LEAWLCSNGTHLDSNIRIVESERSGVHLRAADTIAPGTAIATIPHHLSLSYLDALCDDDYPFPRLQEDRLGARVIGYFYLMIQYVHRDQSFWGPYLETLPVPDADLTYPVFSESAEDLAWLAGTDALTSVTERKNEFACSYKEGIVCMQHAGIDIEPYTW
jgi:hypothetical protein